MKLWTFAVCAVIALMFAGWTVYYFGLSAWTLLATVIFLACPVGVGYYARWQSRQTRLDIEEGMRSNSNTPP